ncbi:MAG: hypothetical protein KDB82_08000 [Planctomycetes bacterium]|nr:hypothetical protein [Planctomycetota bacterium]
MERLLEQQQPHAEPRVSVPFKPMFVFSCVFAVVMAAVWLPILWHDWPINVAVVGGCFAWPLGIAVAWLGQRRQVAKRSRAENPSG